MNPKTLNKQLKPIQKTLEPIKVQTLLHIAYTQHSQTDRKAEIIAIPLPAEVTFTTRLAS